MGKAQGEGQKQGGGNNRKKGDGQTSKPPEGAGVEEGIREVNVICSDKVSDEGTTAFTPPQTREELKAFVEERFGIVVPDARVCPHHATPMDYLWHTYNAENCRQELKNPQTQEPKDIAERGESHLKGGVGTANGNLNNGGRDARAPVSGDCLVWANRGGGKTQLAAMATLLEGLFKAGCKTRIIAGSLDQASRMYEYLVQFVYEGFEEMLDGKMRKGSCRFKNGTTVQVLPQSMPAVRGRHIHKLRCDEIEMFDQEVFDAAKFITHSDARKTAAIEALSTMHKPYGLMQTLVDWAFEHGAPVFRWCLWETIERCTEDRSCSRCGLNDHCRGKARRAQGYLRIDDILTQLKRSSKRSFESEMLCLRPSLEHAVFPEFKPEVHVAAVPYDPTLPVYRAMDFGYRNPFVCLWIQVDRLGGYRVIREYSAKEQITLVNANNIKSMTPCHESRVAASFGDQAGNAAQQNTGKSTIQALRELGIIVRPAGGEIEKGLNLIRTALLAADGKSRLVIDNKCSLLIKSMECYHYGDGSKTPREIPEKDGIHDHAIDALRYFFIGYPTARMFAAKT